MEDRGRKRGEGESEGGSDSEESSKSEEIPSEDACSQCGLPNHPELVREEHVWLCHRLFYHLIVHMTNIWTPLSLYIWLLLCLGLFCYDLGDQEILCLFLFWLCNGSHASFVSLFYHHFSGNIQTEFFGLQYSVLTSK